MSDAADETNYLTHNHSENTDATVADNVSAAHLDQINFGLFLAAHILLENPIEDVAAAGVNEVASCVAFTRAFSAIRAATVVAVHGYYVDARALVRTVYESAGLARMLAKLPDKAEKWLVKGDWFPDKLARDYIESQIDPVGGSPYQAFYKMSSANAHPTARTSAYLAFEPTSQEFRPLLHPQYNADFAAHTLHEIAGVTLFTLFAMRRAMASQDFLPGWWLQGLAQLASDVHNANWSHLEQDWDTHNERYARLSAATIPADKLGEYLEAHPNSLPNIQKRQAREED
ncbi:hypothetical protein [Verrucosispora sp. NA02020]|uniref:hypothetical protein n=1 Tax=Verrucosispora sp. NA02020 TaxID=2742132 RepID=UPI0015912B28|nr:hypothetical protein [Verrucosispora sp. NA02020]QKW13034.1 hypothetical protein HUT12_09660 [Verrucosispora sp. NA02020]